MERKGRDHRTWRKRTPRCTPRKNYSIASAAPLRDATARFEFQKRMARIDWRTLHTIDIDRVIREVDIDALESVLDTVAFGDIQGEDTRNFTEANFLKIFRLAQLMVEYLLHVQDLLADHKSGLLQSRATMEQKNEKIRSHFLCQRDALLQARYELKQAKKTLKTYEVMMKVQEKNPQTSQSNKPLVWHCPFCEKAFESSYYLDMHVARKHQNKQEVTDEKILAVVSTAEEATTARVKAEMSFAVQAEIQQLRERYQADLQRAETNSNTQVRTLQEDLSQSNNQLHEVQTRLEVLQAQILSASPNNSRHAVEKSPEKHHSPNQERLYELESKFSGLERQVKTLGQENSKLLKELNVAYAEVSDVQFAKRQSAFGLETQIDDLRKENQHLRRTMSKVNNIAVQAGDRPDKLKASCQSPENPLVDSFLVCNSRIHSPPKSPQTEPVEVPSKLQEDEANAKSPVHPYHEIPEPMLAITEAKEPATQKLCDVSDSQNHDNATLVQEPSNTLNNSSVLEDRLSPVLDQSPFNGRPEISMPLKKLNFSGGIMLTNMIKEEPVAVSMYKERQGCSPRERWTEKDEALRALARPRIRTEAISVHSIEEELSEGESSPHPERYAHNSASPVKRALRFLIPQRVTIQSYKERPKSYAALKKIKLRGGDNPTTVEEMRAKLDWEVAAAHEEQERRQKAVQQLLAKELVKEKLEERTIGKRTRSEDTGSCEPATRTYSYTSKSETPSEGIAPLLQPKLETINKSSAIHTLRKIVSNRAEKLGPLPETRVQPFHSPPPYKAGPCCKRPLHPYLRRGIGNPQPQPQPRTSFHLAVLSSNPGLKKVTRNRMNPNNTTAPPSKEHIIERLSAVTRELGKYFPTEFKPKINSGNVQPTLPDSETIRTEEDEAEKGTTPPEEENIPSRLQEISEVAATDVGEVAHTIPIPDTETETETETQEMTTNDFSGQLRREFKKFGITSTTNGISDTTYKSISSALEMQRSMRMSQIHGDERQIVEYERHAVVRHTQLTGDKYLLNPTNRDKITLKLSLRHRSNRSATCFDQVGSKESGNCGNTMAVRDRDLVTVKPPFNVVTDSGSDRSNTEDSVEEFGRSSKSVESGSESREASSREREMKPGGTASDVRLSSEQSSPQSSGVSESSDDMQEAQVPYKSKNHVNWAKHSKTDASAIHLGPRSPPPEGRVQYVSRTYSWEPTLKQANSSRKNRDPPSRGELIRSIADVDHTPQSEEEEVDEYAFGLGDWDSDEDAAEKQSR